MATPFATIYDRALSKFTDYDLLEMYRASREQLLFQLLVAAASRFQGICVDDLTDRDDERAQYNATLADDAIEVLAIGIAAGWVNYKVLNSELLHNQLSTKEASTFSPANLMRELQVLRKSLRSEFWQAMQEYDSSHTDRSVVGAS